MLQIVYFRIAKHLGVVLSVLSHAFGHVLLLLLGQWKPAATARRVRLGYIEKFNHRGCCIRLAQRVAAAAAAAAAVGSGSLLGCATSPKLARLASGLLLASQCSFKALLTVGCGFHRFQERFCLTVEREREREEETGKIRWATFSYLTKPRFFISTTEDDGGGASNQWSDAPSALLSQFGRPFFSDLFRASPLLPGSRV